MWHRDVKLSLISMNSETRSSLMDFLICCISFNKIVKWGKSFVLERIIVGLVRGGFVTHQLDFFGL
jgi:hypothetical protein